MSEEMEAKINEVVSSSMNEKLSVDATLGWALAVGGISDCAMPFMLRRMKQDYGHQLDRLAGGMARVRSESPQMFSDYREPVSTEALLDGVGKLFAARQKGN